MFIHTSNKTENLLAHLAKVIESQPLRSPFCKELFLVQSKGMEQWLVQQLALHFKVWANYLFLFPHNFFSEIAQIFSVDLNDQAFSREQILWRLEALLRAVDKQQLAPLKKFIAGDNQELKRFQLAQQLAQVFDQYQILRPNMLLAWQQQQTKTQHPTESWQRWLWLQLTDEIGSKAHRGELWRRAITIMNQAESNKFAEELPKRVSIFGLNILPPLFIDFLQSLSRHCQVHLYLCNPSQMYWADLASKKQIARRNLSAGISVSNNVDGHPLLANFGQQGREFQQMLLEQADFSLEYQSFEEASLDSLSNLQQLHNDLLNNDQKCKKLKNDGSISIHSCHSAMREVQVIKDQLLEALENCATLELRNIVVMTPNIQTYEPFIAAVFNDIAHTVADLSLRSNNEVLDIFIQFLRLSQSRFGWQEVLDLLEHKSLYPSFGLSETDLPLIQHWVQATNIRWGSSSTHKKSLSLPEAPENTWRHGLERLLMGYMVGLDNGFVEGVLPYTELEGNTAQALGGLNEYIQFLCAASKHISTPRTLTEWTQIMAKYTLRLFGEKDDSGAIAKLNEMLVQLSSEAGLVHQHPVTLAVIISWLENTASERTTSGFLRGKLTFCSMLPMRSIPFKVVVLMGLSEGEFPRVDRYATFNLMGQQFIKGDRSCRADDRYQFLEALLSARKQLIISYVGQSSSQNQTLPPSVVVSELLDVLREQYQLENIICQHRLQPFSQYYFNEQKELFSYAKTHCKTAQALQCNPLLTQDWWQGKLPIAKSGENKVIDLADLLAFFKHPQKYFLLKKLAIRLTNIEQKIPESEPFILAGLEEYKINQRLIENQLQNKALAMKQLQAEGCWPSGSAGEILWKQKNIELEGFIESIKKLELGLSLPYQSIDIVIDGYRLVGKLAHCYQDGSLLFRYAKLKAQDFMQAWLQHLLLKQQQAHTNRTFLLAQDIELSFPEEMSIDYLPQLLEIYLQGQYCPSKLLLGSALAYIKQARALKISNRTKKTAINAAQDQLEQELLHGFNPELALIYRHQQDIGKLLDTKFKDYCKNLLLPAWNDCHDSSKF